MILLAKLIIAIGIVLFFGYIVLRLFSFRGLSLFEIFPLSFALGSGCIGLWICFLFFLKVPLNIISILFLPISSAFYFFLHHFKKTSDESNSEKDKICPVKEIQSKGLSFFEILLIGILVFSCFYVLLYAGSFTFTEWDAWCTWGYKAKAIFLDRGFNMEHFFESPNYIHPSYPLLLSSQMSFVYFIIGEIDESKASMFCAFYFVVFISLFYSILRKQLSRRVSLMVCFFLSTTPLFMQESLRAYADVPFSFYATLVVFNLFIFMEKHENARLWLSAAFLVMGMWMKNEGLAFWIAIVASLALFSFFNPKLIAAKIKKVFMVIISVPLLFFSPWIIIRIIFGLKNDQIHQPITSFFSSAFERFPIVIKRLITEMLSIGHWNIFWFVFFIFVFLYFLKPIKKHSIFILYLVGIQLIFFIGVYTCFPATTAEMQQWLASSFHRGLVQLFPIALFFIIQQLGVFLKSTQQMTEQ